MRFEPGDLKQALNKLSLEVLKFLPYFTVAAINFIQDDPNGQDFCHTDSSFFIPSV